MKDIEKIKSEDLAAQVQDANPANFAIEQEVAQLVGATVPAPTEPSADDARELGAQLLVFLRRALLPIRSALRTAVAAIYAHLDSRCTDYTPAAYAPFMLPAGPYDPMRPFVPRTLPNLLQAITAFSARKISNGSAPNDGIPDGTSLAHLLAGDYASVTAIVDDNKGWEMNRVFDWSLFPNLTKLHLGLKKATKSIMHTNFRNVTDFAVPYLEEMYGQYNFIYRGGARDVLRFPALKKVEWSQLLNASVKKIECPVMTEYGLTGDGIGPDADLEEFIAPILVRMYNSAGQAPFVNNNVNLWKVVLGHWETTIEVQFTDSRYITSEAGWKLIHLEIGADGILSSKNINLSRWNPRYALDASRTDLIEQGSTAENNLQQFLQNFREHIALRLTSNGSGLTLTLSQAVFDTIWNQDGTPKSTDPDSVIYQINQIIKTDKHWSVNRA